MNYLFNASGRDRITLWYLDNRSIRKKSVPNRTWIFVTGAVHDLEFLSGQLDEVEWIRYSWDERRDIYGLLKGIRIDLNPSCIRRMVEAIDVIGLGRKLMVYNADINPSLRYLSENNLTLFPLESPDFLDIVPEITQIEATTYGKELKSIVLDGKHIDPSRRESYAGIAHRIQESGIVIYGNYGKQTEMILERIGRMGIDIPGYRIIRGNSYESYGQVHYNCNRISMSGRLCIESSSFTFSEAGLPGLIEVSRISSVPLETASVITPGTAVSSMEVSFALKKGVLVPLYKNDHEAEKTVRELIATDRGGLVLQPDPGLYRNVYEIDFSSMYPSIIVRHNLSPETITRGVGQEIPGTPYRVRTDRTGFLSEALSHLLSRRLYYKSIRDREHIYAQRDTALKWMLLTSFGYTGYKNAKFGRIEVHESITSTGRWAMTRSMRIAESMGFKVIHGIVDSLWIEGDGDVDTLLEKIREETRIDIVMDGHYAWILFLPSRSGIGALNRYLGLRTDGTYKARGIEVRRSDVPDICRKFQMEAMKLFENCFTPEAIVSKRGKYKVLKDRYTNSMHTFPEEDFYINVSPSRRMEEYGVNNISRIVMKKWKSMGHEISPGENVSVKVVNWKMRVVEPASGKGSIDYAFYRKYVLRAFEAFDYLVECAARAQGSGKSAYKGLYFFSEN